MKKENLIIGSGAIILLAIIVYFFVEKKKREDELIESRDREQKLDRENTALRNVVTDLKDEVNEIIDRKDELPKEVKSQLKSLIEEYKDIDEKVTDELLSVKALIDMKEEAKAIMNLAKIIENLLKKIYKGDRELKSNPRFFELIDHAEKKNLIEKDEYYFLNGMREIRNQEAHNLSVKKGFNIASTSFLIGLSIILKLARTVRACN